MKHFEFRTYVDDVETVKIPKDIAEKIERDRPLRVIVLVPDGDQDQRWADLTTEQFLQGYADTDAVYDDVSAGV